jgi:hypothetical protein
MASEYILVGPGDYCIPVFECLYDMSCVNIVEVIGGMKPLGLSVVDQKLEIWRNPRCLNGRQIYSKHGSIFVLIGDCEK